MTIQLVKKGKPILFDSSDWILVSNYKWYVDLNGYAVSSVYGKGKPVGAVKMHRLILGVTNPKELVDHKNRVKTDNRRLNLRVTDPSGNSRNTSSYGACKYLGVMKKTSSPYRKEDRFVSRICIDGKVKYLGTFKSPIEAAKSYNEAALKYFGEFASLNKI